MSSIQKGFICFSRRKEVNVFGKSDAIADRCGDLDITLCLVQGRLFFTANIFYYHIQYMHDDVIKWKPFPRYKPFVRGIHRSPMNSPHKGQWRGTLMFSLICAWIKDWVNNREAGDLRRYRAHYDVTVMARISIAVMDGRLKKLYILKKLM